jgi:hypothetical protein
MFRVLLGDSACGRPGRYARSGDVAMACRASGRSTQFVETLTMREEAADRAASSRKDRTSRDRSP